MKKAISILAVTVIIISMMSLSVFAHGGQGNGNARQQACYTACTVTGCETAGPHQHDGVWYCDQSGCGNYEVCTVSGCTQIGLHEHNGVYYRCASFGTGRGCGKRWNQK